MRDDGDFIQDDFDQGVSRKTSARDLASRAAQEIERGEANAHAQRSIWPLYLASEMYGNGFGADTFAFAFGMGLTAAAIKVFGHEPKHLGDGRHDRPRLSKKDTDQLKASLDEGMRTGVITGRDAAGLVRSRLVTDHERSCAQSILDGTSDASSDIEDLGKVADIVQASQLCLERQRQGMSYEDAIKDLPPFQDLLRQKGTSDPLYYVMSSGKEEVMTCFGKVSDPRILDIDFSKPVRYVDSHINRNYIVGAAWAPNRNHHGDIEYMTRSIEGGGCLGSASVTGYRKLVDMGQVADQIHAALDAACDGRYVPDRPEAYARAVDGLTDELARPVSQRTTLGHMPSQSRTRNNEEIPVQRDDELWKRSSTLYKHLAVTRTDERGDSVTECDSLVPEALLITWAEHPEVFDDGDQATRDAFLARAGLTDGTWERAKAAWGVGREKTAEAGRETGVTDALAADDDATPTQVLADEPDVPQDGQDGYQNAL